MTNNIQIFRQEFLGANTWAQRKDGVPLYLLDKLSPSELKTAEDELIQALNPGDTWPVLGLGHTRCTRALPKLYNLLHKTNKGFKITVAHAIFMICKDPEMIAIVLEELPKTSNQYELIEVLYLLPAFNDEKITAVLNNYREHKEYLVAYNATRALSLPTDEVVKKALIRNKKKNFWSRLFG